MSLFEYASALLALVIGLGFARLLAGVSDMIKFRDRLEFDALSVGWHLNLLFLHFGWWVLLWNGDLQTDSMSMARLGYALLTTSILYIAAHLLAFDHRSEDGFDLSAHFNRARRPALVALSVFFVMPVLRLFIAGRLPLRPLLIVVVLVVAMPLTGAFGVRRPVQLAAMAIFVVAYIALAFTAHPMMSAVR